MSDLRKEMLPIVAIHEAAHVVVGQRHGMPFRYVTLTPRPGQSWGHVKPVQSRSAGGYHCHHLMPRYAAGAIAQDIATGCQDRAITTEASRGDFTEVRECARLVRQAQRRGEDTGMDLPPNATVRQIVEAAWADAHRIVVAEYGAIAAIADALLSTSRAITQADCRRIIDGADKTEPPASAGLAEQFWPPLFMRNWWEPERMRIRHGRVMHQVNERPSGIESQCRRKHPVKGVSSTIPRAEGPAEWWTTVRHWYPDCTHCPTDDTPEETRRG